MSVDLTLIPAYCPPSALPSPLSPLPDVNDLGDLLDAILQRPEPPTDLTAAQLDELAPPPADDNDVAAAATPSAALAAAADHLAAAAARHSAAVRSELGMSAGANAVVTSGRVVELPASAEDELTTQDFDLLELFAQRNQYSAGVAALVAAAAKESGLSPHDPSSLVAAVSSILAAGKPEDLDARSGRVAELIASQAGKPNFVTLPASSSAAAAASPLLVQAILDPLSKPTQRIAPLLRFLQDLLGADVQLLLNPQPHYDDLPLKTFYRYNLPPVSEAAPRASTVTFWGLPPSKILTLGMDEPESW